MGLKHYKIPSPQTTATAVNKKIEPLLRSGVTIQVLDSSPHVRDKSALYSGSRLFVLRAWQPQAAMPAAQKPLANHRRVPIYRARVVRSSE